MGEELKAIAPAVCRGYIILYLFDYLSISSFTIIL